MFHFDDRKKEGEANEFFFKFNATTNKLKKRFLKKPNISEVCQEYCALARECESLGNHQYMAFCFLHAAKCQDLLKDKHRQLYYLVKAGRKFIEIERKFIRVGCPSIGNETFQAACDTFDQAIILCEEIEGFNAIGPSLATETAKALGSTPDGIRMLRLANEKSTFIPAVKLLVSYLIKEDDYYGALQVLTDLTELIEDKYGSNPSAYYNDILNESELSKLFLLLILQPTSKNLTSSQSRLLEKYSREELFSDEEDSSIRFSPRNNDEMILIQSLILVCQNEEYDELLEIESELWVFLTDDQKDLLRTLVKTYCKI